MAVNDVDLRRASHDEAAAALKATAGSGRQVRLTVQYRPEDYNRYEARLHEIQQTMTGTLVRTSPKRTLYVRALFDYDPAKARMMNIGYSRECKDPLKDRITEAVRLAFAFKFAFDGWQLALALRCSCVSETILY